MKDLSKQIESARKSTKIVGLITLSSFLMFIASLIVFFAFDSNIETELLIAALILFLVSCISAIIYIVKRNAYVDLLNSLPKENCEDSQSKSPYGKGQSILVIAIGAIFVVIQFASYLSPKSNLNSVSMFINNPGSVSFMGMIGENLFLLAGGLMMFFGIRNLKSKKKN